MVLINMIGVSGNASLLTNQSNAFFIGALIPCAYSGLAMIKPEEIEVET
jgi:hypothetical protein